MKIEFSQARYLLSSIKFDPGVDHTTLIEELKKQKWTSWGESVPMGHENYNWSRRYRLMREDITSPLLKQIHDFLQSIDTHEPLLEALYSFNPGFEGMWSLSKDQMRKWATLHMEFMLDKPGFKLEPHNDYRRLVGAGMIYFTEHNDPDVATTFYEDRQLTNPVVMNTEFGSGWFAANAYENYHSGINNSNYDRYSVLLGLTIKTPDEYDR
jgi:hypothetical protein